MITKKMDNEVKDLINLRELNINWKEDNDEQILRSLIEFVMKKRRL